MTKPASKDLSQQNANDKNTNCLATIYDLAFKVQSGYVCACFAGKHSMNAERTGAI